MNKLKTVAAVIVMAVAAIIGLYVGDALNGEAVGVAILFSVISGIACIIYAIDNHTN